MKERAHRDRLSAPRRDSGADQPAPGQGSWWARAYRRTFPVANEHDGGFFYWLGKYYAFGLLALLAHLLALAAWTYGHYAVHVPMPKTPKEYRLEAPAITRLLGLDGRTLAEYASEYRKWISIDRIPKTLQNAFIAVEDRRFREHSGIDWRGIMRAAWTNIKAGRIRQGGSTITQQVAKIWLGPQRTLTRKIREAILAMRLERRLTKDQILEVYLNQIFLGNGAYGVAAAAKRYFGKHVQDLDLAEMAMLAGLAQAPSRYSPIIHPDLARRRRNVVLDKMAAAGFVTREEAEQAKAEPLGIKPTRGAFALVAPYYAEEVRRRAIRLLGRRALERGEPCPRPSESDETETRPKGLDAPSARTKCIEELGRKAFYKGGYQVETGVDTWMQASARRNADELARWMDKRQGWRGPEAYLATEEERKDFRARAESLYGIHPLEPGKLYLGLVERVIGSGALVQVGGKRYSLPLDGMRWAARYVRTRGVTDRTIRHAWQALMPGDVIWVRSARRLAEGQAGPRLPASWPRDLVMLEQTPRLQAALLTYDHHSGNVLAMVGGTDYDKTPFNRTTQACRQPGSTFKPIYYSLALDKGWTFDKKIKDIPYSIVDPETGRKWLVHDFRYNEDLKKKFNKIIQAYQVTLEFALVWSKNNASVHVFRSMGAQNVVRWARRLGFTTPLIPDDALALGASCTKMDELARAFGIFARNGAWIDLSVIRKITDRRGNRILDRRSYDDPVMSLADRMDRVAFYERPRQAISPETGYRTSLLLRRMVQKGHAEVVRMTRLPTAGKTGTSSRTSDTWFVGYTSRWLTAAWMGDDHYERPIGTFDASFNTALPMWARYMFQVSRNIPLRDIPWRRPNGTWLHPETGRPQLRGKKPRYKAPFERMKRLIQARRAVKSYGAGGQ